MNKIICSNCGYKNIVYETNDNICIICNSILNEDKEEFFDNFQNKKDRKIFNAYRDVIDNMEDNKEQEIENETISLDEVVRLHIISSFKKDIEKMGKERVWKVIERLVPAEVRMRYRKFYFLAIEELKENND